MGEEKTCPWSSGIEVDDVQDDYGIVARIRDNVVSDIIPANPKRKWMDETPNSFANRCLPLLMANSMGWEMRCPKKFYVTWTGKDGTDSVKLHFPDGSKPGWVQSHFGCGLLTFHPGYLFKTSKGHGLYVKGPANQHKEGIFPCEGFVETDWLPFTFTMNWKIVEVNEPILFEEGDVFCHIFPYPKEYIQKFNVSTKEWNSVEDTEKEYSQFSKSRNAFNEDPNRKGKDWQKNYFTGCYLDGTKCTDIGYDHHTRWNLNKFEKED